MTKKEMIKELVKAWVRNSWNESERVNRFCKVDAIESRIDRRHFKKSIEHWYQKYLNDPEDIEYIIDSLTGER